MPAAKELTVHLETGPRDLGLTREKHWEQEEAMANATRRPERAAMAPRRHGARSSGSGLSVEPQRHEARDREREGGRMWHLRLTYLRAKLEEVAAATK